MPILRDATVVLVDDDESLLSPLAVLLRQSGYSHTHAMGSAGTAVVVLETMGDPALSKTMVIMDVSLGPADRFADGCEAGRWIVRRWPQVRMLYFTGHDQEDVKRRCWGPVPLVHKPVAMEELVQIIGHMLTAPPWHPPFDRESHPFRRTSDKDRRPE